MCFYSFLSVRPFLIQITVTDRFCSLVSTISQKRLCDELNSFKVVQDVVISLEVRILRRNKL